MNWMGPEFADYRKSQVQMGGDWEIIAKDIIESQYDVDVIHDEMDLTNYRQDGLDNHPDNFDLMIGSTIIEVKSREFEFPESQYEFPFPTIFIDGKKGWDRKVEAKKEPDFVLFISRVNKKIFTIDVKEKRDKFRVEPSSDRRYGITDEPTYSISRIHLMSLDDMMTKIKESGND